MSDKPLLGQRVGEGERREQVEDYSAALAGISAARVIFVLVLVLSLLIHVGAYAAARWGGMMDSVEAAPATGVTGAEERSAATQPAGAGDRTALREAARLLLPLTEFLGRVSCGLLAICFLVAANVSLSGRLGGVRGSLAAFFWAVMLFALLVPWSRWLGYQAAAPQVPGVFITFEDLRHLPDDFRNRMQEVLHYTRFVAYPVIALLILLAANIRFGRGYRLARRHLVPRVTV